MNALKMILFSLAVIGFYSWYANYIPQIESHPPRKISLDAGLSGDEMIAAGERVFNSKGTCNICHAIGRPGNRGPDLANIQVRAAGRIPGTGARQYLLESLLEPAKYLVKGYGPLMPPMGSILTPGEIMVTVAYLESLGGEPGITPNQVREALAKAGVSMAPSTVSSPPPQAVVKAPAPLSPPPAGIKDEKPGDAVKGREAYMKSCMPCHGPDPAVDGPVGPKIKGATPALLAARVLLAAYPPGFTPARLTKLMPPMPHLQGELAHLAKFLAKNKKEE